MEVIGITKASGLLPSAGNLLVKEKESALLTSTLRQLRRVSYGFVIVLYSSGLILF